MAVAARRYADGPPPARTGGFGEPTCHECHSSEPLNDSGGVLRIDSLPAHYVPGTVYRLQVVLARAGLARGGFQLAVRQDEPAGIMKQAGVLEPADDRSQLAPATPAAVQYLEHTRNGTARTAADTIRWWLRWRAPQTARPVVFHIAANAANDDNSAFGDFIYTAAWHVLPVP